MAKKRSSRIRRTGPTFIQASRRVSAEQKALYHQVEGAGRSGVLRPFLGLTPEEEAEVDTRIQALVDGVLKRT